MCVCCLVWWYSALLCSSIGWLAGWFFSFGLVVCGTTRYDCCCDGTTTTPPPSSSWGRPVVVSPSWFLWNPKWWPSCHKIIPNLWITLFFLSHALTHFCDFQLDFSVDSNDFFLNVQVLLTLMETQDIILDDSGSLSAAEVAKIGTHSVSGAMQRRHPPPLCNDLRSRSSVIINSQSDYLMFYFFLLLKCVCVCAAECAPNEVSIRRHQHSTQPATILISSLFSTFTHSHEQTRSHKRKSGICTLPKWGTRCGSLCTGYIHYFIFSNKLFGVCVSFHAASTPTTHEVKIIKCQLKGFYSKSAILDHFMWVCIGNAIHFCGIRLSPLRLHQVRFSLCSSARANKML